MGQVPAKPPVIADRRAGNAIPRYTLTDPAIPVPPPTQEEMAKMGAFIEETAKAGVLLATGGLGPLEEAVKVRYHNGEFTVRDGPFTEAKGTGRWLGAAGVP